MKITEMPKLKFVDNDKGRCGHVCPGCGLELVWPMYVWAHQDDELTHTCNCGTRVTLQYGGGEVKFLGKKKKEIASW